jgi:excisionase family DNA binding protein
MIPDAHRVVAEHDSLAVDRDFGQIAKPRKFLIQLARVLVVVAGHGEYLLAPNLASEFESASFWTDAEVSEKVEHVVRFYCTVQAFENRTIHRLDGVEGTITISDDIFMVEMKIGSEPNVRHSLSQSGARYEYRTGGGAMGKTIRMEPPSPTVLPGDEHPWTVREAAAFLGVSQQTVYLWDLWVQEKKIPHLRVMGRNIRFLRSDLETFRASFKQEVEKY